MQATISASFSTVDSGGPADTIHGFDAASDTFTLAGIDIAGSSIQFVDGDPLIGGGQASAHLLNSSPGNDMLQIDTDSDGQGDMDISLQGMQGTLHSSNFLLTA